MALRGRRLSRLAALLFLCAQHITLPVARAAAATEATGVDGDDGSDVAWIRAELARVGLGVAGTVADVLVDHVGMRDADDLNTMALRGEEGLDALAVSRDALSGIQKVRIIQRLRSAGYGGFTTTAPAATTLSVDDMPANPTDAERRRLQKYKYASSNYTALKEMLFENYDHMAPPEDAEMSVQLALQTLSDIDTAAQTVKMMGWWRRYWVDSRLAWDPDDFGGNLRSVVFDANEGLIWLPDDCVYESMNTKPVLTIQDLTVKYTGEVTTSEPLEHTFFCAMNLKTFPYDKQKCHFTYGSWAYNGHHLDLKARIDDDTGKPKPIDLTYYTASAEWAMTKIVSILESTYYTCCPHAFPTLFIEFHLQRESLSYTASIVLPLILVTFAGFLTFFMNPNSGERVGLCVTVLLTDAAIYLVAEESMPKIGHWTVISMMYISSFVIALITMVISVISVSLYNVKASEGVLSEKNLLTAFLDNDTNHDGCLQPDEMEMATLRIGLHGERKVRFEKLAQKAAEEAPDNLITFPIWYEICSHIKQSDGLASVHSPLIGFMINSFLKHEHSQRKKLLIGRYEVISADLQREAHAQHERSMNQSMTPTMSPRRGCSARVDGHDGAIKGAPSSPLPPADEDQKHTAIIDTRGAFDIPARSAPRSDVLFCGAPPSADTPAMEGGDIALSVAGFDGSTPTRRRKSWDVPSDAQTDVVGRHQLQNILLADIEQLADPTELLGRKIAGKMDMAMSVCLPLIYAIMIGFLLGGCDIPQKPYTGVATVLSFDNTTAYIE